VKKEHIALLLPFFWLNLRSILRGCTRKPNRCSICWANSSIPDDGLVSRVASTNAITSGVSLWAPCGPRFRGIKPDSPSRPNPPVPVLDVAGYVFKGGVAANIYASPAPPVTGVVQITAHVAAVKECVVHVTLQCLRTPKGLWPWQQQTYE
jgi:hypothetical protein